MHSCCSSTQHKPRGAGLCTPPAGGKRAWLACRPAAASFGRSRRPPEPLLSFCAGRPAAAGTHAAASPAHPRRPWGIASARRCPERDTQETHSTRAGLLQTLREQQRETLVLNHRTLCLCLWWNHLPRNLMLVFDFCSHTSKKLLLCLQLGKMVYQSVSAGLNISFCVTTVYI